MAQERGAILHGGGASSEHGSDRLSQLQYQDRAACISVPVTPVPRSSAFALTRGNADEENGDEYIGGIALRPTKTKAPSPSTTASASVLQPISPSSVANIRVRRSNYGSKLLQSPARAGHSTCMKKIFQDSGREKHALYPQLPNISRKATQLPAWSLNPSPQKDECRAESLHLFTKQHLSVPHHEEYTIEHQASLHSSESWSDDSGYIITEPRERNCSFMVLPNERINAWLLEIPDADNASPGNTQDKHAGQHTVEKSLYPDSMDYVDPKERTICRNSAYAPMQPLEPTNDDPFLCSMATDQKTDTVTPYTFIAPQHDQPVHTQQVLRDRTTTNDKQQLLDGGGIPISPLSPNVCIERGPSRYHAAHRSRNVGNLVTPTKFGPSKHYACDESKENTAWAV